MREFACFPLQRLPWHGRIELGRCLPDVNGGPMSRPTYLALIFVSLLLTPLLSPAQPGEKAPPPDFLWPGVVTGNALDPMPAFAHRMGWWREKSLREAGGATSSEAAVVRGLQWLIKQQLDGHWTLTDTSEANPIAATSLALLPFLAAGKTHKPHPSNPYSDEIAKGLQFLIKSQDPKTGFFGGDAHALATITIRSEEHTSELQSRFGISYAA